MKRRTLDIAFSIGGIAFSVLLLILGLVLNNQANFAEDYVKDQLGQQDIVFTPAEGLSGEQDAEGGECLVEYAGQELSSGKMAECYANQYIAFHMAESAKEAGYEGKTYATIGGVQRELRAELAAAEEAGEPTEEIQAKIDEVNGLRDSMFRGETLRGLLLTTYGFSIFGDRAAQAALVAFIGFAVLLLLSIAGLVHAALPKSDHKIELGGANA